jgi:hypothetical protein
MLLNSDARADALLDSTQGAQYSPCAIGRSEFMIRGDALSVFRQRDFV